MLFESSDPPNSCFPILRDANASTRIAKLQLDRTAKAKLVGHGHSSPKLCRFFAISRESGRCLAEKLNLLHTRSCVLGEVEDVDLAAGENDPHAYGRVTEAVDAVVGVGDCIVLQSCLLQNFVELALDEA